MTQPLQVPQPPAALVEKWMRWQVLGKKTKELSESVYAKNVSIERDRINQRINRIERGESASLMELLTCRAELRELEKTQAANEKLLKTTIEEKSKLWDEIQASITQLEEQPAVTPEVEIDG